MSRRRFHPALESVLERRRWVALVGSGVSRSAPTSLPLVGEILPALHRELARTLGLQVWRVPGQSLRWEVAMETLRRAADDESVVTRLLVRLFSSGEPNACHRALAARVPQGGAIFTTNFDRCLETVGRRGLTIVKLHGCVSRPREMVASVRQAGRGLSLPRPLGVRFRDAIRGRTLLLVGYGAADDFDVNPLLLEPPCCSRIVYIQHDRQCPEPVVARLAGTPLPSPGSLPRLLFRLVDLGCEILVVRGDTPSILGAATPPLQDVGPPVTRALDAWLRWLTDRTGNGIRPLVARMLGLLLSAAGDDLAAISVYEMVLSGADPAGRLERQHLLLLKGRAWKRLGAHSAAEACLRAAGAIRRDLPLEAGVLRALLFTQLDRGGATARTAARLARLILRAKRAGQLPTAAHAARDLVWPSLDRADLDRAEAEARDSIATYRRCRRARDVERQIAWTYRDLSWVLRRRAAAGRGRFLEDAENFLTLSVEGFRQAGDIANMAQSLRDRATLRWQMRRASEATADLAEALGWFRALGSDQVWHTCDPAREPLCAEILEQAPALRESMETLDRRVWESEPVAAPDEDLGAPGDLDPAMGALPRRAAARTR